MRFTEIKIDSVPMQALLVAGGPGFKIYTVQGATYWLLVVGRKKHIVEPGTANFRLVSKYINLKYQPIATHDEIKKDFLALIANQSEMQQPDQSL
ncbi:MAG: hypothetical protein EOP06_01325 [Proteobacteria bacterium]|nr:MAG: hypothetical protein EOP06_01325 [Pseudomonadota bacterium]